MPERHNSGSTVYSVDGDGDVAFDPAVLAAIDEYTLALTSGQPPSDAPLPLTITDYSSARDSFPLTPSSKQPTDSPPAVQDSSRLLFEGLYGEYDDGDEYGHPDNDEYYYEEPGDDDDNYTYGFGMDEQDLTDAVARQEAINKPLALANPCWGLPMGVVQTYAKMVPFETLRLIVLRAVDDERRGQGVTEMYQWQHEALSTGSVLDGTANLVYSAPTSAGKTFVAEMLTLRRVLSTQRRAMIIFPFVSIVSEKEKYLKALYRTTGLRIEGYYGNMGQSVFECDIAVCTMEKANGLVNKLLEEDRIHELAVVVVDELHMIGDESRGYLLELLLTKLRVAAGGHIQLIGMSATLPNVDVLAKWLNAELYITDYRPVPLVEFVKVKEKVYNAQFRPVRVFKETRREDPDHLIPLCWDVVQEGKSVLIFCAARVGTEKCAIFLATHLQAPCTYETHMRRLEVREALRRSPAGLDPVLEDTVLKGVAFHHAGLTTEEREIIEDAFRNGCLHVLTATCTLAAGVNLPARRVIFRTPYIGRQFLQTAHYKQMKGRAGRKGQDTMGESVLLCRDTEFNKVKELVHAELEPVRSCLVADRRGMKRALLEVIAAGVVSSQDDIKRYAECTLLCAERTYEAVKETTDAALAYLTENEFIACAEGAIKPTKLGTAVVASGFAPEEGLVVFRELKQASVFQALGNFVLEDELHVVYHVTPIYLNVEPIDYATYNRIYNRLNDTQLRIANLVGVSEGFLVRAMMQGVTDCPDPIRQQQIHVHRRFYASLILNDLVHEVSLQEVGNKYNVNKGLLQTLQMTSSTFAGMVTTFCQRLGWRTLESIVKGYRARALYQAGFKTVASLATAEPHDILTVLANMQPFRSTRDGNERSVALQQRLESRASFQIVRGARELLAEETRALRRDLEQKTVSLQRVRLPNSLGHQVLLTMF
ncbi:hypothetical protein RI367_005856 [Sorochytrium milnesiophthora]